MEWSTQEMDSQSPKLSLDLSPPWIHPPPPHSVKATRRIDESSSELRDYISALEDELRKIEVFKRELPLSHVILNDAIAKLKKDESNGRSRKSATAITAHNDHKASEINLVKSDLDEDQADKRSWLRSVQLWSSYSSDQSSPLLRPKLSLLDRQELKTDDQAIKCRNNDQGKRSSLTSNGTCLLSRKGEFASTTATISHIRNAHYGDELGVVTSSSIQGSPTNEAIRKSEVCGRVRRISSERYAHPLRKSPPPRHLQHREALQAARRKQRRCWSPDLHRRFVDALEKLGGSQVATPKQIREVMQVDGLTNDEVKSHLQKYRLHIRKLPSTCSSMSTSTDEQLFLEDDSDRIKVKGSKSATGNESGSPEGPLHMSVFRSAKSNSGASRCDDNTLEEEMRDAGRGEYEDEDETSDGSHSLDWKGCSSLNLK